MKHLSIAIPLSMLFLVTACAPSALPTPAASQPTAVPPAPATQTLPMGSPAMSPTPARVIKPTAEPTFAPNSLNIRVKVENDLAASVVVTSTGGSVSVKTGDGTKITLTVPKDALLDETKITLTPVIGVEGLPFTGGLVGAVQMAPEGTRLLQPASLIIESAKATAGQGYDLVAFAYHQSGEGFYLTPAQAEPNRTTIPIWHFSGGGVAGGTPAEIRAQQQRVPANAEDALSQRMADYSSQQRKLALEGKPTDPGLQDKNIGFLHEYFNTIIKPQLAIAAQDCEASKAIIPKALGWARSVALWGFDKEFSAETDSVIQALGDALVNCYNKEYDQCTIDKDIKHRSAMLGLLRQATLLSPAEGGGLLARLDTSKVEKCPPRYKVDGTYWGYYNLTGIICNGLDKPIVLEANANLSGAHMAGQFTLTPTGTSGGNWSFSGAMDGYPVSAGGVFSMEGAAGGSLAILMGGGSWTITVPFVGTTPIGPGGEHLGTTERIELKPTSEQCQ